MNHITT